MVAAANRSLAYKGCDAYERRKAAAEGGGGGKRTVSQIWSLMGLLSMVIIRAPNSTPMVRSCTGWKRLSVNCSSRHDFPTPARASTATNH